MSPVQLVVPIRVSPEWFQALETGVVCTGVQITKGDHGDYDLRLHGTNQETAEPPTEPEPEKPNRATRRRTSRSKA